MKTVYIVGAGASNAAWGFPVLKNFLNESQPVFQKIRQGDREPSRIEEFLQTRFNDFTKENLEDVLADLDNSLSGLGGMWYAAPDNPLRQHVQITRTCLVKLIEDVLFIKKDDERLPPAISAYDNVLGSFKVEDKIITFNYDEGIERYTGQVNRAKNALTLAGVNWNIQELFSDQRPTPCADDQKSPYDSIALLKLHGSIGYITCSNPVCPTGYRIFLHERISHGTCICSTCGGLMETLIVPPSMLKSFERYPKISVLWRYAERALVEAERIVLWGFSCPTTDHHVVWLFRNGLRLRKGNKVDIAIIDESPAGVAQRIKSIVVPDELGEIEEFTSHEEYASQ